MRWVGLPVLLLVISGCSTLGREDDPWFSADKAAHFASSALIGAAAAHHATERGHDDCQAALLGVGVAISFGAAKETYDKRVKKTYYSSRDMVWNIVGGGVGAMLASGC